MTITEKVKTFLSPARRRQRLLQAAGLKLLNRGKVRDTYRLPDSKYLLSVVSDGISIFDIVLNFIIPFKGYVLNLLSVFWFKKLEEQGFRTHFVAAGAYIDQYLPESLRGRSDLQARAMVIKKLKMYEYELIYRYVLTGSVLDEYKQTGMVAGHKLPAGLQDGDLLPRPLFTPSTKATSGHDINVTAEEVFAKYPRAVMMGYEIFTFAIQFALDHGILLADTKFEFGEDEDGNVYLGDEVLTPDSSRFWLRVTWLISRMKEVRKAPSSFDKQPVRNAGIEEGIKALDNTSASDVKKAWSWKATAELIRNTTLRYRYIFWRLTGQTVEDFARDLRVELDRPRKNVVILLGSESDLTDQVKSVIADAIANFVPTEQITSVRLVTNFSCHRQYGGMDTLARTGVLTVTEDGGATPASLRLADIDYFIAGAGMAAQLPAMLKAALTTYGKSIPVIGLGFGTPHTDAYEAARLSISQLPPGSTVHMDEVNGQVYMNADGLAAALERIATGEFPPLDPPTRKPIHIDVPVAA